MRHTLLSLITSTTLIFAQSAARPALEGLDPVMLIDGKEVPGSAQFTAVHGHFTYQFASAETMAKFKADPQANSIQGDGQCARMGAPVTGNPDTYWVYQHKIYIFGSTDCYKSFSKNPEKYLAAASFKPEWNPSSQSRAQGQTLLDKVIAAAGGAQLGSIRNYVETRRRVGDLITVVSVRLPDSFRDETKAGPSKFGRLITPAHAYRVSGDDALELPKSVSDSIRLEWKRDLLPILVNRKASGFDAYSIGQKDGAEQIVVNNQGSIGTLLIDPASSRVTGLLWKARGPEGVSEYRLSYSDYRDASGVQLPFTVEGSIDGQSQPRGAWTVDSYQFNLRDIDARFEKPLKVRVQ